MYLIAKMREKERKRKKKQPFWARKKRRKLKQTRIDSYWMLIFLWRGVKAIQYITYLKPDIYLLIFNCDFNIFFTSTPYHELLKFTERVKNQ